MNGTQCLFLGYNEKKTKLINFLKEKKLDIKNIENNTLSLEEAKKADLIVSFGYQHLIKKEIIQKIKRPAINLHMSFLPYNRGSNPNYWSFVEDSPKGITIHEIDEGADTGNIMFQKNFNIDPKIEKFSTFKKTYNFLFNELENLFIENFNFIVDKNYKTIKQEGRFSSHKDSDMPKTLNNWDTSIVDYIKKNK